MKYLVSLALILITLICYADVYMHKDKEGNVIYSDTPPDKGAVKLPYADEEEPGTPTPSSEEGMPPETQTEEPPAKTDFITVQPTKQPYTNFSIQSPADQATFQNQPIIPVDIKVEPDLQEDDSIQLYMDGKPLGPPLRGTHFELNNIDRGTHQLYAELIDDKKNRLKQTNIITIYVHKAHLGTAP